MSSLPRLQEDAKGFFVWDSAVKKNIRLGYGRDRSAALSDFAEFLDFKAKHPSRPFTRSHSLLISQLYALFLTSSQRPTDKKTMYRWKRSLQVVAEFLGPMEADAITAPDVVRLQEFLAANYGHSQPTIRKLVGCLRRLYAWAFSYGHVTRDAAAAVKDAEWVTAGYIPPRRTAANPADVRATIPHLAEPIRTIVKLIEATGCRPSEVCSMTAGQLFRKGRHVFGGVTFDLDAEGVWLYVLASHKTAHLGKGRVIALGPDLQALLAPYLVGRASDKPLFSPAERMADWRRRQKVNKRPPKRPLKAPQKTPGIQYSASVVTRAIKEACRKAGVPVWTAYQLRYLSAGRVQSEYGTDAARAVHGHVKTEMTEHYSGPDVATAIRIAKGKSKI